MNKDKLLNRIIEKVYNRTDLDEDEKQEILYIVLRYMKKTHNKNYYSYVHKLASMDFKKHEDEMLYLEDLNLYYTMDINEDKMLSNYIFEQFEKDESSKRYIKILKEIYFEGFLPRELAEIYNISEQRIRQIRKFALINALKNIYKLSILKDTKYESILKKYMIEEMIYKRIDSFDCTIYRERLKNLRKYESYNEKINKTLEKDSFTDSMVNEILKRYL